MIPEKTVGDPTITTLLSYSTTELPTPYPPKRHFNDLFTLKGKTAIITGGKRGIGLAVAELYAQGGANVAIIDYEDAKFEAEQLANENGIKAGAYQADVSDESKVKETIESIAKEYGTVDVFIANAGIVWKDGNISDDKNDNYDSWRRIIDININGVYYCARHIGKIFKAQGHGSLVITASMSGSIANIPMMLTPYNLTKSAVKHLAKSLAVEWADFARVNSVSPGYCDTGINDHLPRSFRGRMWSLVPLGREATPQEIAAAFVYLGSDASSYVTGTDLIVDGGYTSV